MYILLFMKYISVLTYVITYTFCTKRLRDPHYIYNYAMRTTYTQDALVVRE
jgi:hypothetical protein